MAYDEMLAERISDALGAREGLQEKKMFGGIAFMLQGNMVCGVAHADLIVRVGPDNYQAALATQGARPMDFGGRPMRGMVFVDASGYETETQLRDWLDVATRFGETLPPKAASPKRRSK